MDLIEQKKVSAGPFKRHPWELTRLRILCFWLKRSARKKFIVDVGSGDAFIAREITKAFDCTVAAVDINYDDTFIENNRSRNLFPLKQLSAVSAMGPADVVLLMDVLEHVETPGELLRSIRELENLSPQTQLIITVPAFQSLFNEHDIALKHFRRYNRKQLKQLLQQEGFEIRHSGYFFTSLLPARILQVFTGTKPRQGLHNWEGSRWLTLLATTVLWIDFKICWYLSRLGINLPGLSCYCICHPSLS